MTLYVPNSGENELIRGTLASQEWVIGLYRNVVAFDGSTTMLNITEMPTGGGRGYAPKVMNREFATALTAGKWYIATNAQGKGEAQYSNTYLEWEFNGNDVADGNSVYGVFVYTNVLPFFSGSKEIKVGDTIKGATSGATGKVHNIVLTSGGWSGGNAAGLMYLGSKSGSFQNSENLHLSGEVGTINSTPNAGGSGYAVGDVLEITGGGGNGCLLVVTAVNGGAVSSLVKVTGGSGYSTGTGLATTAKTGSGTGCTVNITALANTAYAVSNSGTLFGGDAHKVLIMGEPLSSPVPIDVPGRKIRVTVKWTLSSQ